MKSTKKEFTERLRASKAKWQKNKETPMLAREWSKQSIEDLQQALSGGDQLSREHTSESLIEQDAPLLLNMLNYINKQQEAELKSWKDAAYEWNCTTPEELRDKIQKDQMRQW